MRGSIARWGRAFDVSLAVGHERFRPFSLPWQSPRWRSCRSVRDRCSRRRAPATGWRTSTRRYCDSSPSPKVCGSGEQYVPMNINRILGNDEVVLRGPWDATTVVKIAPTADDLEHADVGYHLDFPGDALDPGCAYERFSRRAVGDGVPVTYAHVASQSDRPGKLALQYWFFYAYNDFNNKHEGDWEMIQLVFDANDAEQALTRSPAIIGYSQHEGAEKADWGDAKLQIVDGTHPVAYPAAGSHANYFDSALWLGRTAQQGVGCDDTRDASHHITPTVAYVPAEPAAYLQAYPWLGYPGAWGEKQSWVFNGPTGPNREVPVDAPDQLVGRLALEQRQDPDQHGPSR